MKNFTQRPANQAGFSLIEMMVGVAIGLIALVVIIQMLVSSETRKRTTSSGGDAQVSGVLGLFNIERDIRLAGHGFGVAPSPIMGCTVDASVGGVAITPAIQLFPVQIVNGVSGAPDSIISFYGNSSFMTASQTFTASSETTKKTQTRNGFQLGDVVIVAGNDTGAASSANCSLVQVTENTNADNLTFAHGTNDFTSFYTNASAKSAYNTAAGTGTTYTSGALYNLGNRPTRTIWSVDNFRILNATNTLTGGAPTTTEIAEGVANLQAEYGVDSNNDGIITDGSGTPPTPNEWVTTTPTDWTKVRAIRVALLTRSRQFEREMVTTVAPTWQGGAFTMFNLDGTAGTTTPASPPNNWRNYRYRVYEKVIPLRNMIWGTAP
jgi:type IV pilus assembly protein PilW